MHFIVTGGAGFIGSHVTEQLLSEGYKVTVVDNLTTGRLENLTKHPRLKLLKKDITAFKPEDFPEQIDGIAHLAATPSVTESWLHPLEAHHNNLSSTISVMQLMQTLKIPRLVFASSAAVYGNPIQVPVTEDHPTSPLSPYGLQKLVCEQYANLFAKSFDFSFVGLRMFNVFGSRQVPNSPYSGVISIFASAMQQNLPITIYGDGMQTRDFVYVKDVAIAFTKALTLPLDPGSCLSCNLGTGKAITLLQLVDILKAHFPDWKSQVKLAPARLGDIQHSLADIRKISTVFKFVPQWSLESAMPFLITGFSR